MADEQHEDEQHGSTGEQHETDWKAEARKWESRAKENKSAAEELAQMKEANATDLEKAKHRAEKAEKELSEIQERERRSTLVHNVMSERNIPTKFEALLTASDEDGLTKQADLLKERFSEPVTTDTGKQTNAGTDKNKEFAHKLFSGE